MHLKLISFSSKVLSLSFLFYSLLLNQVFAYNLQAVRFLPMGDGANGQDGVILGVTSLIQGIGGGLAVIAGAVAVLFIVINGAKITFSFGNSEMLSQAKKGLMWSIAGLLLVVFAYVLTKSIVALVYSGEGSGSASGVRGSMTFNRDSPNHQTCMTPPALPVACYFGDTSATQSSGYSDPVVCEEEALVALKQNGVCTDMGITGECTIDAIQQKAVFTGLPSNCSRNDGKYGQCTKQAIKNYYTSQCGSSGTNTTGTSSLTSNPRQGELVNERQTLMNQFYLVTDQYISNECDSSRAPNCNNIRASLAELKVKLEGIGVELEELSQVETNRAERDQR